MCLEAIFKLRGPSFLLYLSFSKFQQALRGFSSFQTASSRVHSLENSNFIQRDGHMWPQGPGTDGGVGRLASWRSWPLQWPQQAECEFTTEVTSLRRVKIIHSPWNVWWDTLIQPQGKTITKSLVLGALLCTRHSAVLGSLLWECGESLHAWI